MSDREINIRLDKETASVVNGVVREKLSEIEIQKELAGKSCDELIDKLKLVNKKLSSELIDYDES